MAISRFDKMRAITQSVETIASFQQLPFQYQPFMPRKIRTFLCKLPQDYSKFTVDAILTAAAHILTENGYGNARTNRIVWKIYTKNIINLAPQFI